MATATKQNKPNNQGRENSSQSGANEAANELAADCSALQEDFQTFVDEVGASVSTYCRKRPGVAACILFGLGFYMGWKIKPW